MASRSRPQSSTQKSEPALIGAADAPAGKARRPFSSPVKAPRANTAQPRPRAQGGGDSTAPSGLAVRAPDDDSEISDILDTAPPLTVTRSPMKLAIATGGDQTLAAKQPLNTKQFAYTRRASSAGSRRVILSKDAMELEMKEMRSFNRDVYETRVRQNYLEEQVARKLYAQKISMQRHARLAEERARHDGRIQREFALGTPFLRERAKAEALQKTMDAARAQSAPVFADLQAIQERLRTANLSMRGVDHPGAALAKPASVTDLARRAQSEVPPSSVLLNPRNQMTSPLPPKELLLPRMPPKENRAAHPVGNSAAKAAIELLPELFEAKRSADAAAERKGLPRPSLPEAVKAHLAKTHAPQLLRERLAALRFACGMYAPRVARVAIFQAMMGWTQEGRPWDNTKSAACLLLMLWLQPPQDDAAAVSRRFVTRDAGRGLADEQMPLELKLSDVDLVIKHLLRKRLVSPAGARALPRVAAALELPSHEDDDAASAPPPPRAAPCVDVDQLLLKWMSVWGTWEWRDDRELLQGVINRFQPPRSSPTKLGKGNGLGKLASKLRG